MAAGRPALDAVLAERVRPVTLARDRHMPIHPALGRLLPEGLQHSITVAVTADASGGATTLALLVAAGASAAGGWVAAVGLPDLGLVAADQLGIRLDRMVVVNCDQAKGGQVVAALLDGFPMILVGPDMLSSRDSQRLAARLREQGNVVVIVGPNQTEGTTLRLAVSSRWDHDNDLGPGREVPLLTRRLFSVRASGRGLYGIERHDELLINGNPFGQDGLVVESRGLAVPALRKVSG